MSDILDKIAKLLRLSESSNPHEAEVALARAYELARRHKVDLAAVNPHDTDPIEIHRIRIGQRLTLERRRVFNILQIWFSVKVIISHPYAIIFGRPLDLQIALYAHDFLLTAMRASLRQFRATKRGKTLTRNQREGYIDGWAYGVHFALDKQERTLAVEDSAFAIAPSNIDPRLNAAAEEMFPKTKTIARETSKRAHQAIRKGFAAGRQVNVRTPLTNPETLRLN